jgi:CDGSH-type Zn-finger protein
VGKPMGRMRITVTDDGPYLVTGGVPLVRVEIVVNDEGESVAWRETARIEAPDRYKLCRCGLSEDKPFCDMTHAVEGFDGAETAGHESYGEQAVPIDGPGVRLHDARRLCAEARFCDRAGGLWHLIERCDDPDALALAEEEAMLCPSGRYVLSADSTGLLEPEYETSIAIIDDPFLGVSGPLWVRGGIPVVDAEGVAYEVRNRMTLCRCGSSANKPFCDGSHIKAGFRDEG